MATCPDESGAKLADFHRHCAIAHQILGAALSADEAGDLDTAVKQYEVATKQCKIALAAFDAGFALVRTAPVLPEWEALKAGSRAQLKGHYDATTARLQFLWDTQRLRALEAKAAPAAGSPPVASKTSVTSRAPLAAALPDPVTRQQSGGSGKSAAAEASASLARQHSAGSAVAGVPRPNYMHNVDKDMAHRVLNEIVESASNVKMADIVGLDVAKKALHEIVVLPALRPELFTGLRAPCRGLLLFGPPGNGKTMLAKAVANECGARFFNISASTVTSKFLGDGEKLVRALFACARELQPSVIFIDEIDSLLRARSDDEHEATRRLKTELLVAFDGVGAGENERILVMGATNTPQQLDEAALRRFTKRILIPLPNDVARMSLLEHLLKKVKTSMSPADLREVVRATADYSGSDLTALARDAAMGPIRELGAKIASVAEADIRPVSVAHFRDSLRRIRPSVNQASIRSYDKWNAEHGVAPQCGRTQCSPSLVCSIAAGCGR